jgi:hypothetical protein
MGPPRQHLRMILSKAFYIAFKAVSGIIDLWRTVAKLFSSVKSDAVQVAVVVPIISTLDNLNDCINSILTHEAGLDFEVFLVNLTNETNLKHIIFAFSRGTGPRISFIRPTGTIRMPDCVLTAIPPASGKHVVVISQDLLVSPEWLRSLVHPLRDNKVTCTVPAIFGSEEARDLRSAGTNELFPPCFAIRRPWNGTIAHLSDPQRAKDALVVFNSKNGRIKAGNLKIVIKTACPGRESKDRWGDYHFAVSLAAAFLRRGVDAEIKFREQRTQSGDRNTVNIVLRGLHYFKPVKNQLNLMWIISHPNRVESIELNSFDHVFAASELWPKICSSRCQVPITTLLQCSDTTRFHLRAYDPANRHSIIFVANSRKVERPVIKKAIEERVQIEIYGEMWDGIAPANWVKGTNIPNIELPTFYAGASAVLNDHWDDMREYGFISNRLFDVLACGRPLVTDSVKGIPDDLLPGCHFFDRSESLVSVLKTASREPGKFTDESKKIANIIKEKHSFDVRAESILEVIEGLL